MIRLHEKRTLIHSIVFSIISLLLISSCLPIVQNSTTVQADTELTEIQVGVYNGEPAQGPSALALKNMFEWMGATVIWLDGEAIRNGTLNNIDLVVFGGGSANNFALDIGETGIVQIRQFIASGGSYFGICGGGNFASDHLGLCSGTWMTDIPGMPGGAALTELSVNQVSTSPDLSSESESYQVYFSHSAYFRPTFQASIIRIMSYPTNDEAAMFVARYGSGTLFASGPHPEYEEGSHRDGSTVYDFLHDPDSEWDILQRVTQWLIDESSDNANLVLPISGLLQILIAALVVSLILIGLGFTVFYRRRLDKS
jgi:glutamine amidotransferase-like uncharacterized protein